MAKFSPSFFADKAVSIIPESKADSVYNYKDIIITEFKAAISATDDPRVKQWLENLQKSAETRFKESKLNSKEDATLFVFNALKATLSLQKRYKPQADVEHRGEPFKDFDKKNVVKSALKAIIEKIPSLDSKLDLVRKPPLTRF